MGHAHHSFLTEPGWVLREAAAWSPRHSMELEVQRAPGGIYPSTRIRPWKIISLLNTSFLLCSVPPHLFWLRMWEAEIWERSHAAASSSQTHVSSVQGGLSAGIQTLSLPRTRLIEPPGCISSSFIHSFSPYLCNTFVAPALC